MAPSDWASLPADLVRRVADLFLAASDVDYYTILRAVCCNWRTATDDPRGPGPGPDPRFSIRGWVPVTSLDGCRCLFLHVDTGRFMWKELPMLRNHNCVASTEEGHLILEPLSTNSRICLLNPITGHLVRFPVTTGQFIGNSIVGSRKCKTMFVAGSGSSPMVFYSLFSGITGRCIDLTWDVVYNRESIFRANSALGMFAGMVPFKGRAYTVYKSGSVAVVEHNCRMDEKPVVTTLVTNQRGWIHRRVFLVDNAGELLLVRHLALGELEVFRVDVDNRVLEQIKTIRNRAIFLGERRCISVNAYNLPGIECNCLYYIGNGFASEICIYRLNDGSHMELPENIVFDTIISRDDVEGWIEKPCPKSLARVLMKYTCYGSMF